MALAFVPYGKEVEIQAINTDEKMKKHLHDLGLLVGEKVVLIQSNGGNVILQIKGSKLALNQGLAMKIFVA